MKRNTMRILSLVLTLVMLLGAVPFAAAVETTPNPADGATIIADPNAPVWAGTEVELMLDDESLEGYAISGVEWFVGSSSTAAGSGVTFTHELQANTAVTAKYTATPTEGDAVTGASTVNLKVKTPSEDTIAIIGDEAAHVGVAVSLRVNGDNDSEIEWSVDKTDASVTDAGVFTATKAGEYIVTATAVNDPENDEDDVEDTITITVTEPVYTVTMADKTVSIADKSAKLTYTAKKGTENATGTAKYEITSGTNVVTVNQITGLLSPKAEGTAAAKVTVTFADGATASDTATVTVTASGVVFLEQDGEATDDDEIDLEFSVVGPGKNDEVEWTFEVSALNIKSSTDKNSPYFVWSDSKKSDKRDYEVEEDGPEIEVELTAKKGYGIAVIKAYANWTGNSAADAEGTFYISFYDEVDYELTLKKELDEFDWDEDDVFSAGKKGSKAYTATELKSLNLAELLNLEAGTFIDFDEGRDADDNEDVGTIEGKKKGDYDPDEVNTFEMDDLEDLTFEVEDEGSYIIEYVQYDKVNGYGSDLKIGEGVLEIIVGEGDGKAKKGDINYDVKNKGEVELDEDDFEEFFEEYCDDEDITGDDADFGYVMFDYKATKIEGTLYGEGGDKSVKNTYRYHFDYDDDEDDDSKDYDLNDMVYEASSSKTNYIDEIDFTCYSDEGEEICDGTVSFTVGEGEKEVSDMAFTDVKEADWYYDAVKYVYEQGIMAGTSTTKFSPDTNLTRGMIVTMLYRVEGSPSVTATNKFTDVKSGDYYYDAVRWAAKNGIVTGTTTTTFSPNTNITRQDLATILYRYVKEYKGETASLGTLAGFADASQVSDYATSAMKWAVGTGIVNGVGGSLLPKGNATRAQAATMFQRLLAE